MRQQMTARYPGRCHATGHAIRPGDLIEYDRATRRAYLIDRAPTISTAAEIIDYYDTHPDLTLRELANMTGRTVAYLKGLLNHPEQVKA